MKVRSSSGKPVAWRRAQTIARSSSVAFQGSLCGRLEWSRQSWAPRLRHLRMVSGLTPKRMASTFVGSDERAISWRTAGVVRACGWMDSITSSCGGELGVAGRQSAKYTPQSRNAPDPNNVPLPNIPPYAVVNALRHVLQLPDEQCHKVFEKLIKALEQNSRCLHQPLLRGICFRQLKQLVMVVSQCRLKGQKLTFATRPLRLKRQQRTLPHLWTALDEEVGPTCVAIVGLAGITDHWCVVARITPRTLWLLDAAGQTRICR